MSQRIRRLVGKSRTHVFQTYLLHQVHCERNIPAKVRASKSSSKNWCHRAKHFQLQPSMNTYFSYHSIISNYAQLFEPKFERPSGACNLQSVTSGWVSREQYQVWDLSWLQSGSGEPAAVRNWLQSWGRGPAATGTGRLACHHTCKLNFFFLGDFLAKGPVSFPDRAVRGF